MDFLEAPFGVGVDSVPAWGYPPSEPTPGPGGSVLYAISVQDSATEALYQELAGHGTSVLRLDSSMGLADLTAWMQQGPGGYAALHLYSHGSPGRFQVGGQEITTGNLPASGEDWSSIGSLLAPDGDLLIYGCSVGRGAVGVELVEALASLTSADVAASINPTGGGAVLIGSWRPTVARLSKATRISSLTCSGRARWHCRQFSSLLGKRWLVSSAVG